MVLALSLCAGCRNASQATSVADDVARAAQRLGLQKGSTHVILDDLARATGSAKDDLARAIVLADDATPSYQRALDRLLQSDVPKDVGKAVLCDTLGAVVLQDSDALTAHSLGVSLARNLAVKLGGTTVMWAESADSIARDIADGKSSRPLWARVFMLKIQHC